VFSSKSIYPSLGLPSKSFILVLCQTILRRSENEHRDP
jgi:hypothetical protein